MFSKLMLMMRGREMTAQVGAEKSCLLLRQQWVSFSLLAAFDIHACNQMTTTAMIIVIIIQCTMIPVINCKGIIHMLLLQRLFVLPT